MCVMDINAHPLQHRVHEACIAMIDESWRQKCAFLFLSFLLLGFVELLRRWLRLLAHERHARK